MKSLRCPRCDSQMEDGFLVDHGDHHTTQLLEWAEGEPARGFFGGLKLKGRARYEVLSRRCTRCGLIEIYALDRAK